MKYSIFSRWQKGKRLPGNRKIVITIIELFIERQGIRSLQEANKLLESANQGYLTEREKGMLNFHPIAMNVY